jgi:solute carrier family 25 (mitochondrial phosphate transporter), member 23/24/25/41
LRFQAFKIALTRTNPVTGKKELPSWGSFAAGSLSGVVSTVATHPMETLQTRLAVSAAYKSAGDAMLSIMAKEGPLALFGGLGPSLIGIIPYAGLNLGFYDGMRTLYTKQTGKPVPKTASLVFGALAGASAASVTFPLEVVRRRMMMGQQFANTGAAIVAIAKAEGVGALFAGLGLNWVKVAPSSGLSIWSYELLKDQLKV